MTQWPGYAWPSDLPAGCPLAESVAAGGAYYRFVRTNPCSHNDFLRPIDTPRYRGEEHRSDCALYALSVYALIDDARRAQDLIPAMRKRFIAKGELNPSHGVVNNSPDKHPTEVLWSHHDWWTPVDIDPTPLFIVEASEQ